MMDDRCEICGESSRVVEALVRLPDGRWIRATVHIACENNRMAKMRYAGMTGRN